MESILIGQESIDLYNFRITNKDLERQAIIEIQTQILKWLQDAELDTQIKATKCNSILLNKLTYYIANEIEKKNRHMIISRGWYKYGPCYEAGRHGEESLTLSLFDHLLPSKRIIPDVESICEKEVPLFLKYTEKSQYYPFEYLKHIYNEKVDYPKIQNFYTCKHLLTSLVSECQKNPIKANIEKMNKLTMDFDKEILSSVYRNVVGIPVNDIDLVLEFTSLMNQNLNDLYKDPNEKQTTLSYKIVDDFINIVLMTFANKNYIYTFRTSNSRHEEVIKSNVRKAYDNYIYKTQTLIGEYYQKLNS